MFLKKTGENYNGFGKCIEPYGASSLILNKIMAKFNSYEKIAY